MASMPTLSTSPGSFDSIYQANFSGAFPAFISGLYSLLSISRANMVLDLCRRPCGLSSERCQVCVTHHHSSRRDLL